MPCSRPRWNFYVIFHCPIDAETVALPQISNLNSIIFYFHPENTQILVQVRLLVAKATLLLLPLVSAAGCIAAVLQSTSLGFQTLALIFRQS
jgi:hypothetical protein